MTRIAIVLVLVALSACASVGPSHRVEEPDRIAYQVPLGFMSSMAAVGPAYVDSFAVTCATTATLIRASAGTQIAYTCQNSSTTKVAVGDSGIGDPTSAQNSPIYCATNCPSQEWQANARSEYCMADTGTVDVFCRALVSTVSPP